MDPDRFGPYNGFDPTMWSFGHLAAATLGTLFWLALLGFVLWSVYQLSSRQPPRVQRQAAPSAMELLRQRYVTGDIDAMTFEEMVERVLASEAWERQQDVQRLVRPRPPTPPAPPMPLAHPEAYMPPVPPVPPVHPEAYMPPQPPAPPPAAGDV